MSRPAQPPSLESRVALLEARLAHIEREKQGAGPAGDSAPKVVGPNFRDLADVDSYANEGDIKRYRTATGKWTSEAFHHTPGARVTRFGADTTVPSDTSTAMSFTAVDRDDGGLWSSGAPTRLTLPEAGWYVASGNIKWTVPPGVAFYTSFIRLPGTNQRYDGRFWYGQTSGLTYQPDIGVAGVFHCTAGQYLELIAYQSSGADRTAGAATFAVTYLGPLGGYT